MSSNLTNPLQNFVNLAAKALPANTGKVATQQEKIDRRSGNIIILADISASMNSAAWGGQRKIDLLREAVDIALNARDAKLFVFSEDVQETRVIPQKTQSSTALHKALAHVRPLDPGVTLVISDGRPDDQSAAIDAAKRFRGVIDVLYIGPEGDGQAIDFMRRLAAAAGVISRRMMLQNLEARSNF